MSRMGPPQATPPATSEADAVEQPLTGSVIDVLVANHREFLGFLERRVGDRALAEDILQEAFVRGIDRIATLREGESVVAWFYRSLRNAATDTFRRKGAEGRALERAAHELSQSEEPGPELQDAVCRCVARLADTLKPEYAVALRRIEVDGLSVKDYAAEAGVSPGNAAVRVFRAREALRQQVAAACGSCAEHGCLECHCKESCGPASAR
jgi:RNA polymerase sigma-70 factor (ECF subfamily)